VVQKINDEEAGQEYLLEKQVACYWTNADLLGCEQKYAIAGGP